NLKARVLRDSAIIYTSEISSLKHGKEDVREAKLKTECGITLRNFTDFKPGDIIETFKVMEKK
ncbi:unnamed protein product, partial [Didymodactylos carnosus]